MSYRAVIVDWGGVLTAPLGPTMQEWADGDGVDLSHFTDVLSEWRVLELAESGVGPHADPVARLERGEIPVDEFEHLVAAELTKRGSHVQAQGLLGRILAGLQARDESMFDLLERLRGQGIQLALLSNSWGNTYDRSGWELFETVVISGEVGMRKPEERIYRLVAERLGRDVSECVMIDDLVWNIEAAARIGMAGIVHTDAVSTRAELSELLGTDLGGGRA